MRTPTDWTSRALTRRLRRRYRQERLFHALGIAALVIASACLAVLLYTIAAAGTKGFVKTSIAVPFDLTGYSARSTRPDPAAEIEAISVLYARLGAATPAISDDLGQALHAAIAHDPSIMGRHVVLLLAASPAILLAERGEGTLQDRALLTEVKARGLLRHSVDWGFLGGTDKTEAGRVGIWGAVMGSVLTMLVTLGLAFPVGVLSAVYLEEFAPRNMWTALIEVSINNLAAVPSIIFGLLGLAVLIGIFGMARSSPLVGGVTLALMTMPVIVIAARNALKAVPPSIREAAHGIGASPVQVVAHHVLPLALPGVLTGTIIAMSRALGETAPLLLIGMRVFLTAPPQSVTDPATVLPMQIFLWSNEVGRGFIEKTSAAILVLLIFLLAMNGIAIYLRNRFEIRW